MYIDPSSGGTLAQILLVGFFAVSCFVMVALGGVAFIIARREDKKTLESRDEGIDEL